MLLVTGGRGQLGRAVAVRGGGSSVLATASADLNICDGAQVERVLAEVAPAAVINCAAYTKVDLAESHSGDAWEVNYYGAATLAKACRVRGVPLVHVSTDYVFDGRGRRPYREDDPVGPVGVYGASKEAGELAVRAAGGIVVRTSWLFGEGGPSFVHTMVRLARERPVLRVVDDQRGCPTYAGDLAGALIALARMAVEGRTLARTYQYCGDGQTTWHGFATAIVDELRQVAPEKVACERVDPIVTAEYPTTARRPAYSVLDTSRIAALGIVPLSWREGMRRVVQSAIDP